MNDMTDIYRLPTEAEWEYAARAGTQTAYSFGDNWNLLPQYAWFGDNSGSQTHAVASLQPVTWPDGKLYDMAGNVWEWAQDWYATDYGGGLGGGGITNPTGPLSGPDRVIVGGSWLNDASLLRSAFRALYDSANRGVGFRPVRTRLLH